MKLRDRRLERKIRRAVRTEVKRSRSLRKDTAQFRRSNPRRLNGGWFFMLAMPPCLFHGALSATQHHGLLHLGFVVLITSVGLLLLQSFLSGLHWSQDLYVLSHFPVSAGDFFTHEKKAFLRRTWVIPYMGLVFYGLLAQRLGIGYAGWWLSLALCGVLWAAMTGFLLGLGRWFPGLPYTPLGVGGIILSLILVTMGAAMRDSPDGLWLGALVVPAGWVGMAFHSVITQNTLNGLLLAIPALLLLCASGVFLRKMSARFVMGEKMFGEQQTAETLAQELAEANPEEYGRVENITAEQLNDLEWDNPGWIERIALWLLSPREQDVAWFMTAGNASWTRRWKTSAVGLLLFLGVFAVRPGFFGLAVGAFLVATLTAMPFLGGAWAGLSRVQVGMATMAISSNCPVTYREMSRTLLKINIIRILSWFPLGFAAAWLLNQHPSDLQGHGLVYASVYLVVALVVQPLLISLALVSGTSIEICANWRSWSRVPLVILEALLILSSVACCFLLRGAVARTIAVLVTAGVSWLCWWIHGRLYNRHLDMVIPLRTGP